MPITRRNFLQSSAAAVGAAGLPTTPLWAAAPGQFELKAGVVRQQVVAQPLDERARDVRGDGRHQVQPVRGEARGEHGHRDDDDPPAGRDARELLHHRGIGEPLRPTHVEGAARSRRLLGDAHEVLEQVVQRDRQAPQNRLRRIAAPSSEGRESFTWLSS